MSGSQINFKLTLHLSKLDNWFPQALCECDWSAGIQLSRSVNINCFAF